MNYRQMFSILTHKKHNPITNVIKRSDSSSSQGNINETLPVSSVGL
jgi:hypothetical protein